MSEKYFIPKGSNRVQAETWLRSKDIDVPDYKERKLYMPTCEGEFYWCKDTDIPRDVAALGGIGITGSDVKGEVPTNLLAMLESFSIGGISNPRGEPLRFLLLAPMATAENIQRADQYYGGVFRVGTSYPRTTLRVMGNSANITRYTAGGAEALPYKYDDVDAIYELYQSGSSAARNGLVPVVGSSGKYLWDVLVTLDVLTLAADNRAREFVSEEPSQANDGQFIYS